jgi:hypothetical protein
LYFPTGGESGRSLSGNLAQKLFHRVFVLGRQFSGRRFCFLKKLLSETYGGRGRQT